MAFNAPRTARRRTQQNPNTFLNEIRTACGKGNFQRAMDVAAEGAEIFSTNWKFLLGCAEAFFEAFEKQSPGQRNLSHLDIVENLCEAIIIAANGDAPNMVGPKKDSRPYAILAKAEFLKDNFVQSESYARAGLEISPHNQNLNCVLGFALHKQGKSRAALACFESILKVNEKHHGAAIGFGLMLLQLGRAQDSFNAFDRALVHHPDDKDLKLGRGRAALAIRNARLLPGLGVPSPFVVG